MNAQIGCGDTGVVRMVSPSSLINMPGSPIDQLNYQDALQFVWGTPQDRTNISLKKKSASDLLAAQASRQNQGGIADTILTGGSTFQRGLNDPNTFRRSLLGA